MRRVGGIERLTPELDLHALSNSEAAEDSEIEVHKTGTIERIEASRSKARLGDAGEGRVVVECLPAADISDLPDLTFYLLYP